MKERKVVFSLDAEAELLELYEWIANAASPDVAFGYVTRIEAFCQRLGIASERGQSRDDIRPGLRIIGFERRVTVAFKVELDRVVILRLFYGGRDWETLMS
jgi:toxin ParE1/3/4